MERVLNTESLGNIEDLILFVIFLIINLQDLEITIRIIGTIIFSVYILFKLFYLIKDKVKKEN